MTYTINIYVYRSQLIFTGMLDMYFEKYKGIGPGTYSKPILSLPAQCSLNEICDALLHSAKVLADNEALIYSENSANTIMQMENLLFRNFKSVGIKAKKSDIQKESVLLKLCMTDSPCLCQCIFDGRYMVIQKEIPLRPDTSVPEIASLIEEMVK